MNLLCTCTHACIIIQGNVISLCPPLIITEEQLREAFDILDQCFAELEGQTQKQ